MLTQRHLTLIRAALQFFDVELVPNGMKTIRHYLDTPLDENVTHFEVRGLRSSLKKTELKYGRFNRRTKRLISCQLKDFISGAQSLSVADSGIAVVVLIPTRKSR